MHKLLNVQIPFEYIGQFCTTKSAWKKELMEYCECSTSFYYCWCNWAQYVQCTSSQKNSFEIFILRLCSHNMKRSLHLHFSFSFFWKKKKEKRRTCSCVFASTIHPQVMFYYHVLDEWILIKSNSFFANDP